MKNDMTEPLRKGKKRMTTAEADRCGVLPAEGIRGFISDNSSHYVNRIQTQINNPRVERSG
jgi:hypothetical protein